MKFKTCLLALLFGLVLLLDHFCYGDYFQSSECTPSDVMNNCNSTDCIPGIHDPNKDPLVIGDELCAVFWDGDDEPIPFRVCRKMTNGTAADECHPSVAQNPVQCKNKKFKICTNTPPSGGSGCANFVADCKCKLPSDGTEDAMVNQTCTGNEPQP